MKNFLNNIDRFVHRTLEAMCSLLLAAMVGFTLYNVTMRYVFNNPPVWGDLLTVLSNIWLMFIALSLTARDNEHVALNLIYEKLPQFYLQILRRFQSNYLNLGNPYLFHHIFFLMYSVHMPQLDISFSF